MKRKTTNLEQKLIANQWYLALKTYAGKHSDKTLKYEYHKNVDGLDYVIALDKTRENIIKYGISGIYVNFLDKDELLNLHNKYLELRDFIYYLDVEPKEELLESEE